MVNDKNGLMNNRQISEISIEGFKSIKEAKIDLNMLNVLIGSNGAGKSNFISIFKFLDSLISRELQTYVSINGGAEKFLFFGSKETSELKVSFKFGYNGYGFCLSPTLDDHFVFSDETFYWNMYGDRSLGKGHLESRWMSGTGTRVDGYVNDILKGQKWRVYHFHDTSDSAPIKKTQYITDNIELRQDARNLGSFLYRLRETAPQEYRTIVETIQTVAPFFGDFVLEADPLNPENIMLKWRDARSDISFTASQFSDGTLRFICLATLLLQPLGLMPETIIIDEPELGLHPFAIQMLAEMIKRASMVKQIIVSTQSITLLNEFLPEDVIVVNHKENHTEFNRLKEDDLREWISEEYSLGEMWEKNVFGGRPTW